MPHKDPEAREAYNKANKERAAARAREWREKNKERAAAYNKAYREANKERIAAKAHAYRQRLPDPVILSKLKGSGFPARCVTTELIEVRRLSILIKRELKEQVQA